MFLELPRPFQKSFAMDLLKSSDFCQINELGKGVQARFVVDANIDGPWVAGSYDGTVDFGSGAASCSA